MPPTTPLQADTETLARLEARVLWLATAMVHHANKVRPNASGIKVGGHQASSASMVSIMTALWFAFLEAPDRVSVKPHASPVLHAINHLLGRLDASYLPRLREFGGLQSYPSRTKDPDPVDFSTGSVGIGATAPIWSAIAHRYVAGHFEVPRGGRQIALLGDAELDEGAVWEAIVDPMVQKLGEVLWIVDLNRQSLDRVVPDIAAGRLTAMFEAAGWHCVTVKWGRRLTELFARERGELLRGRIERMPNEEYQRLLRSGDAELRERLPGSGRTAPDLARFLDDLDDAELRTAIRDLGGHDIEALLDAYRATDAVPDRPSVVFAYTIKAYGLATEGHPANHSALLSEAELALLAARMGADPADPWAPVAPGSVEAQLCATTSRRLEREPSPPQPPPAVPSDLGRPHGGTASTQQALGRLYVDLDHTAPEVAARIVTVSPDVASSTNLGGWINRSGVWSIGERIDWFAGDRETLVRWREHDHGRHIELGIAEMNLVGLLGELGATWSRDGQPLLPVGAMYDPFVGRALEPWSFGIYAGGQSILVGTPSGITLAPEGGAHQSIVTPSIGVEQPGCVAYEPAFGQDLEWTFLHALGLLGRTGGTSSYFRLSTRPIAQELAAVPEDPRERDERRRLAIAGGYRLRSAPGVPALTLVGVGAVMVETLAAAGELAQAGAAVDVVCLTSPDLVFRALQGRQGLSQDDPSILEEILPADRRAPIVAVLDGHPHTLAFLAAVNATPIACLGVSDFGQSGDMHDLYRHAGIDVGAIVKAGRALLAQAPPPATRTGTGTGTGTVPDFDVTTDVDMSEAVAQLAALEQIDDRAPSLDDLVVRACARALRAHPRVNASHRDGTVQLHERINVGIAVAAGDALVVPVVQDADRRSLGEIAAETRRLAASVRDGSGTPADLDGATFTVSKLGMFDMTAISPVIDSPNAAILGTGAVRDEIVAVDGEVAVRPRLTLTLTCDHRILHGADAAAFLATVRELLEDPRRIALSM